MYSSMNNAKYQVIKMQITKNYSRFVVMNTLTTEVVSTWTDLMVARKAALDLNSKKVR